MPIVAFDRISLTTPKLSVKESPKFENETEILPQKRTLNQHQK
jgi:hypothetical protein